jgi:hypothetical protein
MTQSPKHFISLSDTNCQHTSVQVVSGLHCTKSQPINLKHSTDPAAELRSDGDEKTRGRVPADDVMGSTCTL